jgi:flagellar protein FlgJ
MSNTISLSNLTLHNTFFNQKLDKFDNITSPNKLAPKEKNDTQLKEACAELESLFIHHLLKEMRATIPKSGFLNGGNAEEIYTSLLDSQLAKELASKGGLGLSSMLVDNLVNEMKQYGADTKK